MNKNRLIDDEYNLDLTYITPRIIAMAFPAEGFESMFRNQLSDVAAFLERNHGINYLIVNASNRLYNYSKFGNRVIDMNWPNHYPCPFGHFVTVLKTTLQFLLEDERNVVVVHCLAGKGRTGSFVNALHFSSGQFKTMNEANFLYKTKRNVNVTYPSQLKYMDYFVDFFNNGIKNMTFVGQRIVRLELRTSQASFLVGSFKAKITDYENDVQLAVGKFDNAVIKNLSVQGQEKMYSVECEVEGYANVHATEILVKLLNPGFFSDGRLFRLNFSMLFAKEDTLVFKPTSVDKPVGLPADFEFVVHLAKEPEDKHSSELKQVFESLEANYADLKADMEKKKFKMSLFNKSDVSG